MRSTERWGLDAWYLRQVPRVVCMCTYMHMAHQTRKMLTNLKTSVQSYTHTGRQAPTHAHQTRRVHAHMHTYTHTYTGARTRTHAGGQVSANAHQARRPAFRKQTQVDFPSRPRCRSLPLSRTHCVCVQIDMCRSVVCSYWCVSTCVHWCVVCLSRECVRGA